MTANGRWAIRLKVKFEVDSRQTRLQERQDSKIESFASDLATETNREIEKPEETKAEKRNAN